MSLLSIVDADFDRRWAAWQERGRAHDHIVNARLRIALPMAAAVILRRESKFATPLEELALTVDSPNFNF